MSNQAAAPAAPAPSTPTNTATPQQGNQPIAPESKAPESKGSTSTELFDVKIEGKVVKMTKEELINAASLGSTAHKRFQEASHLKKQAESILGQLKDPKQALKLLNDPRLGLNQDEVKSAFEEWYYESTIKRSQMSPEQQELADAKARLQKYEDEEKKKKEDQEAEDNKKLEESIVKQLSEDIIEIIETSGLPKTRFAQSRIAYWMRANVANEINAPKEMIVQQVRKEIRDVVNSLVEASDGETLVQLLGEPTVKKLRSYDLQRLKARKAQPQETSAPKPESKPKERISMSEVNRRLYGRPKR